MGRKKTQAPGPGVAPSKGIAQGQFFKNRHERKFTNQKITAQKIKEEFLTSMRL